MIANGSRLSCGICGGPLERWQQQGAAYTPRRAPVVCSASMGRTCCRLSGTLVDTSHALFATHRGHDDECMFDKQERNKTFGRAVWGDIGLVGFHSLLRGLGNDLDASTDYSLVLNASNQSRNAVPPLLGALTKGGLDESPLSADWTILTGILEGCLVTRRERVGYCKIVARWRQFQEGLPRLSTAGTLGGLIGSSSMTTCLLRKHNIGEEDIKSGGVAERVCSRTRKRRYEGAEERALSLIQPERWETMQRQITRSTTRSRPRRDED